MNALLLSITLLASPVHCSPDVGQMRWDHVKHRLKSQSVTVVGSVWDRDRNGRPSAGDIMRIDEAYRRGRPLAVDETWMRMGRGLAKQVSRTIRRNRIRAAACETAFSVRGIPRIQRPAQLAKILLKRHQREQPTTREVVEADLDDIVAQICKPGKNISEKRLASLLERRVRARHRRVKRAVIRSLARQVAKRSANDCTHLELRSTERPQLTF